MDKISQQAVFRILDASSNRAAEGLRTLEDWARFAFDDQTITDQLKQLRHWLAQTLGQLARADFVAARDTAGDVGKAVESPSEYQRHDADSVLAAASARTGQALRVIEEYLKTIDPQLGQSVEKIRYDFYIISGNLELRSVGRKRRLSIAESKLYALVDCGEDSASFQNLIGQLAQAGVDLFQLRDKHQTDRVLIERARIGTEVARRFGARLILNDRADLAVAADCDGVHLGQEELPIEVARRIVGPTKLIGISTHNLQQAQQAQSSGCDYIGCGPIFPGNTKAFDHYPGIRFLQQVVQQVTVPAFAIGGIHTGNVHQVLDAGFGRIAVTGAIGGADDPKQAAKELRQRLDERRLDEA